MYKIMAALMVLMTVSEKALAVWPPSIALQEEASPGLYGFIVLALVIGIAIGVWAQRGRHEHK